MRYSNNTMAAKPDIKPVACDLYFLPVATRVPLKFGSEVTTSVMCARVRVIAENAAGRTRYGWGETPLSVAWLWPSAILSHQERTQTLMEFCRCVAAHFSQYAIPGHPMEVGHGFIDLILPRVLNNFNRERQNAPVPWLAALACFSPFDLALHDAYATGLGRSVYEIYDTEHMNHDLAWFFGLDDERFINRYPGDFLEKSPPSTLVAWHLVGGTDCLTHDDVCDNLPDDPYPVYLTEWIERDGLECVKIKLRGNDPAWDYQRLVRTGRLALERDVRWLSPDFNCTVTEVGYVTELLDRLALEHPDINASILYVEQPFPYDLETNRIDVREVAKRKPLFMDESAHGWQQVELGRQLGWTGVALKTCKTQTGALLSLVWAKTHNMGIMVQDLTNPMLAQIPHVQLAARAGTIMGVESNSMQFYPDASVYEAKVHPGLYTRTNGRLDLSTLGTTGFGYRLEEIARPLPPAENFPQNKLP